MVEQKTGVWIEEDAFGDLLAGIVRERGELKGQIAEQKVMTDIAEARGAALEKELSGQALKNVWLPVVAGVLGFAVGSVGAYLVIKAVGN